MLKKLFKYEWKHFWKIPASINIFLGIITFIGVISLASPFWSLDLAGIDIMLGLSIFFYVLAIAAGSIAVTVCVAVRYYKNVYTDEGYLTNTLPVTARQIVISKLSVGILWSIITGAVVCISVMSLIYTAMLSYEDVDIIYELLHEFPEILIAFKEEMGISLPLFLFICLIQLLLNDTFSILKIYTAIALGQLFARHKVAGAIIWYIGESIVFEIITSFMQRVPSVSNIFSPFAFSTGYYYYDSVGDYLVPAMLGSIAFSLIFGGALYFLTEHMLKNRLNLD